MIRRKETPDATPLFQRGKKEEENGTNAEIFVNRR
jgi:hypothetical protein